MSTSAGVARQVPARDHPGAQLVTLVNQADGTRRLLRGEIDALAAETWTQLYLMKQQGVGSIVPLAPFLQYRGHVAVRLADTALLTQLDSALAQLQASGELDRIAERWSQQRIYLSTGLSVRMGNGPRRWPRWLGALHAAVAMFDTVQPPEHEPPGDAMLKLVHALNVPADLATRQVQFRADADLPLASAARTGEPVYSSTRADVDRNAPGLHGQPGLGAVEAAAALPLRARAAAGNAPGWAWGWRWSSASPRCTAAVSRPTAPGSARVPASRCACRWPTKLRRACRLPIECQRGVSMFKFRGRCSTGVA